MISRTTKIMYIFHSEAVTSTQPGLYTWGCENFTISAGEAKKLEFTLPFTTDKSKDRSPVHGFCQLCWYWNSMQLCCLLEYIEGTKSNQNKVPSINKHCFVFLSFLLYNSSTVFTHVRFLDRYSKLCWGARSLLPVVSVSVACGAHMWFWQVKFWTLRIDLHLKIRKNVS